MADHEAEHSFKCTLQLEDEFVLTRIRNRAKALEDQTERDNYFWRTVYKFVCRERAYKSIMEELGLTVDTSIDVLEE